MSYYVAGILRIVLLEASAALVVMDRVVDRAAAHIRARLVVAAWAIALLSVLSFSNWGALRGDLGLVHPWEQYHFVLGSKYLRELGYFDLYKATLLADREAAHLLAGVRQTRDLHTFDLVPVERALADGAAVRARFTDERWAALVRDWQELSSWRQPWQDILADHGNSGSPAWAVVALPFVSLLGGSHAGQQLLGSLDLLLMAVLFAFLARAFGAQPTAVGLTIFCLAPFSFDYLAGSILRWDWLFASGMALGFWRRERPLVAGLFLGYAVVSKLFPIAFAVGLGAWLAAASLRARRLHPAALRLAGGMVVAAAVFVGASAAVFGPAVWSGYRDRIQVAQDEKFYANQYSFKTLYLQIVESTPRELARNPFRPAAIKQSLPSVDASRHAAGLLVARLVLTLLVLAAAVRSGSAEAFAAGPFLVYLWLTVNAYYWNMLGLVALVLAARQLGRGDRLSAGLLGLHTTWAGLYLYQHLNAGYAEGYFVAILLLATLAAWSVQALLSPDRDEAPAFR